MTQGFKICYDRILPQHAVRPLRSIQPGDSRGGKMKGAVEIKKLWLNGTHLNVRFMGGTAAEQAKAQEEALWWVREAKANLNFEFNNKLDAEIRVAFDPREGAWSWVGTDCKSISRNDPTMNLGFLDKGTAAHEFGHAIGLVHEHQSPRSPFGDKIQWNEPAVFRYFRGEPNYWSDDETRSNVIEKYSADIIRATEFDPESIMTYWIPDEWLINGKGIKQNHELSKGDKYFVGQLIYPWPAKAPKKLVKLGINASATQAEIGKPGEEDLFEFTVEQPGRYVIENGGQTDVVMKLFGPNSQTNLIATDDDGGVGFNARLVTELVPGNYFVQNRHYNEADGTGAYTIRVHTK